MKTMRLTILAFALALMAGACGGELSDFKSVTDKMCDCKDSDCADKVNKEYREVRKKLKEKYKGTEPSESLEKEYKEIRSRYKECRRTARKAGGSGIAADDEEDDVEKYQEFVKQVCACKDLKCAKRLKAPKLKTPKDAATAEMRKAIIGEHNKLKVCLKKAIK